MNAKFPSPLHALMVVYKTELDLDNLNLKKDLQFSKEQLEEVKI